MLNTLGPPRLITSVRRLDPVPAMPNAVNNSLAEKLASRRAGICLYGFAPPKQATPSERLEAIVAQQLVRLGSLPVDGLIVYDIQDEAERVSVPRPFPFLPTLPPEVYAHDHLGSLAVPKIVYRCVNRDTPTDSSAGSKAAPSREYRYSSGHPAV